MAEHRAETTKSNPLAIFWSPEARKFQTVVIGVLVAAATAGLFPAAVATWVLLVVGVLTATGVYVVPNKTVEPTPILPVEEPVVMEPEPAPMSKMYSGSVAG